MTLPTPTSIGGGAGGAPLSLSLGGVSAAASAGAGAVTTPAAERRKLKGGLNLIFTPDAIGGGEDGAGSDDEVLETCAEERRAAVPRYRAVLRLALVRGAAAAGRLQQQLRQQDEAMSAIPAPPPLPISSE